jgi:hypothetical protein
MSPDDSMPQRELSEPGDEAAVPPTPVPTVHELWPNTPFALTQGRYSIGWQDWPPKKGGLGFVTVRRTAMTGYKVVNRYPFTDEGWAAAWREATSLDPGLAEQALGVLARRADADSASRKLQQLNASTLAYLDRVAYLGGFMPGAGLTPAQAYDVRFLEERIAVFQSAPDHYVNSQLDPLAEIPYGEVAAVDVGGPGLTKTGGGFIGGGFGVAGAAEGMAIAGVLNALTTRVKIKTVLRIEAAHAELFFLNTQVEPEALRIGLSRALGAIRQAKSVASKADGGEDRPCQKSAAERLAEVTRLHDEGLLTDEEFQAKRAEIISQL